MSILLGKYNQLEVVKFVDFGLYLNGGDDGEILLPKRYIPEGTKEGDLLNVFLYLDNEERLVATTQTPLIQVGEFGYLEVSWVNQYGAFLNWGLMKDLFVPFREQKMRMVQGKSYIVYCYQDEESFRLMASAKVDKFLSKDRPPYEAGEQVNILIWQKTELGFKAIVENKYAALLYDSEIFQPLHTGMQLKAFVKQVREDGKIDLILQKAGPRKVDDFAETLLKYIREHNGFTSFNDKSDAEEIYQTFGVSKKTFKKAVGELYKMRLIILQPDGISLNNKC
ncbi:MAG: S1-like domain-containing RNA-binding protein [Bacteroidales bacterium]|nr:S1-like domain-containing RNA-binding protein [Bacteroidales bacterium]